VSRDEARGPVPALDRAAAAMGADLECPSHPGKAAVVKDAIVNQYVDTGRADSSFTVCGWQARGQRPRRWHDQLHAKQSMQRVVLTHARCTVHTPVCLAAGSCVPGQERWSPSGFFENLRNCAAIRGRTDEESRPRDRVRRTSRSAQPRYRVHRAVWLSLPSCP
jgi:hypothetical protein